MHSWLHDLLSDKRANAQLVCIRPSTRYGYIFELDSLKKPGTPPVSALPTELLARLEFWICLAPPKTAVLSRVQKQEYEVDGTTTAST